MRIYCYYTRAYQELTDQWFGPSAAIEYEVITRCDADAQVVEYKQNGWLSITRHKVDFIVEAVRQNWGHPFLFSDPDVQLLGPTRSRIEGLLRRADLLFQKDAPAPHCINTGFFACRGNVKTLTYWQAVRDRMERADEGGEDDQDCARALLVESLIPELERRANPSARCQLRATWLSQRGQNPFGIRWNYLPPAFFGGGTLTGRGWQPGMPLTVPDPVLMHHANWTVGLNNKVSQLRYVRDAVVARRR